MYRSLFWMLMVCLVTTGCGDGKGEKESKKEPRPVQFAVLNQSSSPSASLVSASVASWKTEQIGFEVGGRVEWVVEPNTEIVGRVRDEKGNIVIEGTEIARIDSQPYLLKIKSAEAQVSQISQQIKAAKIDLDDSIPAQIRAAEAERVLAETSLNRSKKLKSQNAASQADVDRDQANYESAVAKKDQLDASLLAKGAEIESLEAQRLQMQQSLDDATLDFNNCTLHASFSGQIADVAVVPGSVVTAGQEVATLQMMDPIKVEVEVSAAESRRLRNRQRIPVMVTQPDGSETEEDGFLYLIDTVADPSTRTYTVTLLLLNEKAAIDELPPAAASTEQTWRLDLKFLPGRKQDMMFASESAIHTDDEGPFLWKITNVGIGSDVPSDRHLTVSKVRVALGPAKTPFLGNWVFQQVLIEDGDFDMHRDLVTDKIIPPVEPGQWDGENVYLVGKRQWTLRPGDVVRVDLASSDLGTGYFVPMEAIVRRGGKSYLFAIEGESGNAVVKEREVQTSGSGDENLDASAMRVMPVGEESLEGVRFVTRGAHYLVDGEAVKPVAATEGK